MASHLEVRNLSKFFDDFQLHDITFSLPKGYIMGLLGPNGSGKTTTIKCILNLIRRDEGTITLLGHDNQREERAAKLEQKGFTRIGGSAEAEGRPVTEADLEKLGDALLDRLRAESKSGTKKGGKPKEEPDGSGAGEPDRGDGEK